MIVIPEFPNYSISKDGVVMGDKVKAQSMGKNGYLYVTLYANTMSKKLYVHRLLATAYLPNPENKRTVNHKDGNKTNNVLSNLEWSTDAENIQHAYDMGLNHSPSKVDDSARESMYRRFMRGESMQSISSDYPFNNVTVSVHLRRHAKKFGVETEYSGEIHKQRIARAMRNLPN